LLLLLLLLLFVTPVVVGVVGRPGLQFVPSFPMLKDTREKHFQQGNTKGKQDFPPCTHARTYVPNVHCVDAVGARVLAAHANVHVAGRPGRVQNEFRAVFVNPTLQERASPVAIHVSHDNHQIVGQCPGSNIVAFLLVVLHKEVSNADEHLVVGLAALVVGKGNHRHRLWHAGCLRKLQARTGKPVEWEQRR